jgi:hypothetical protein
VERHPDQQHLPGLDGREAMPVPIAEAGIGPPALDGHLSQLDRDIAAVGQLPSQEMRDATRL